MLQPTNIAQCKRLAQGQQSGKKKAVDWVGGSLSLCTFHIEIEKSNGLRKCVQIIDNCRSVILSNFQLQPLLNSSGTTHLSSQGSSAIQPYLSRKKVKMNTFRSLSSVTMSSNAGLSSQIKALNLIHKQINLCKKQQNYQYVN